MGQHDVTKASDAEERRRFTQKLLADLRALEKMLADGALESDKIRIGAEQELFLVDRDWQPALTAVEVLEQIDDEHFTTELGKFNIECNLDPLPLGGDCLSRLEESLLRLLVHATEAAARVDTRILLAGILPTLEKSDLTLDNMTPMPRYYALNDAVNRVRGDRFNLRIKGRDELLIRHDNVMLEACNTSFQIHLQVAPDDFVHLYNVAQVAAAPVLAGATNSPLLFGKALWRETRIALFQQSVDTRATTAVVREQPARVSFGTHWLQQSALEIFREDLARFKVLVTAPIDEDPEGILEQGGVPKLSALRLHNGTIYRWNRPCYGISDGKPHLRIENRVLPSGPTPRDEIANAAFWYGLMAGLGSEFEDITEVLEFGAARENFISVARLGLGAQLHWPGIDARVPAQKLIKKRLLPLAWEGLREAGVDEADVELYLGVIRERIGTQRTGSRWLLESLSGMKDEGTEGDRLAALVAGVHRRQQQGEPIHTWELGGLDELGEARSRFDRVEQIMTKDLFTVTEDELVDKAAWVMTWKHIRHVPVEDARHRLVGLVTHRSLLGLLAANATQPEGPPKPVRDIMLPQPLTVRPETPTRDALALMREKRISCLPVVVDDNRLVGIISERDFIGIASDLLDRMLEDG